MLTERRERILDLVAESYIRSARAVPSAAVAKRLRISSATVRNEFGALEDAGFLQQPHTSAGRIPTNLGFRRYARRFLPPQSLAPDQALAIRERLSRNHGDGLLQDIARLAAELTGYAVVVSLPPEDGLHALEIHLSLLSSRRLLAVVVLETGLLRQVLVDLDPAPPRQVITEAESSLRQLTVPISEVPLALEAIARREEADLARTLRALAAAWPALNPPRLFAHGLRNLLSEPESRDPEFLRLVVDQVERPRVGGFAPAGLALELEDATARITARLELGALSAGLSVVGPARMRYPEAFRLVQGVAEAVAG